MRWFSAILDGSGVDNVTGVGTARGAVGAGVPAMAAATVGPSVAAAGTGDSVMAVGGGPTDEADEVSGAAAVVDSGIVCTGEGLGLSRRPPWGARSAREKLHRPERRRAQHHRRGQSRRPGIFQGTDRLGVGNPKRQATWRHGDRPRRSGDDLLQRIGLRAGVPEHLAFGVDAVFADPLAARSLGG